MPVMIDVILKEIEIVIILRRQSSKSVIGVDCAYTGIVKLRSKTNRSGDGSLICYYSLNNPVTDARYSGQLSESCSLVA